MVETSTYYESKENQKPKQSPAQEDILKTVKNSQIPQEIKEKIQKNEEKEKQNNEHNTNEVLWITPNNWEDKEKFIRESSIDSNQNLTKINTQIG